MCLPVKPRRNLTKNIPDTHTPTCYIPLLFLSLFCLSIIYLNFLLKSQLFNLSFFLSYHYILLVYLTHLFLYMPTQDLFVLLLNRLSETRLLRLAEVRYLTSFILKLEARLGPADDNVNNAPAERSPQELERLWIDERGYVEGDFNFNTPEISARRTETRASRPERPIAVQAS